MVTAWYFHLAELIRYGTFFIFIAMPHVEEWIRHLEISNAYCSWFCSDKRSVRTFTGVPLERRLRVCPSRADSVFRNCTFRHWLTLMWLWRWAKNPCVEWHCSLILLEWKQAFMLSVK